MFKKKLLLILILIGFVHIKVLNAQKIPLGEATKYFAVFHTGVWMGQTISGKKDTLPAKRYQSLLTWGTASEISHRQYVLLELYFEQQVYKAFGIASSVSSIREINFQNPTYPVGGFNSSLSILIYPFCDSKLKGYLIPYLLLSGNFRKLSNSYDNNEIRISDKYFQEVFSPALQIGILSKKMSRGVGIEEIGVGARYNTIRKSTLPSNNVPYIHSGLELYTKIAFPLVIYKK